MAGQSHHHQDHHHITAGFHTPTPELSLQNAKTNAFRRCSSAAAAVVGAAAAAAAPVPAQVVEDSGYSSTCTSAAGDASHSAPRTGCSTTSGEQRAVRRSCRRSATNATTVRNDPSLGHGWRGSRVRRRGPYGDGI